MSEITVKTDSRKGEPVYRQVARQIREMIGFGRLPAGYRLPSVRTLASDLGVNLNTVARAYRLLEEEGFVQIRGRSRAEVAAPLESPQRQGRQVSDRLHDKLREILARLRQEGLGPEELQRFVLREIDSMSVATTEAP